MFTIFKDKNQKRLDFQNLWLPLMTQAMTAMPSPVPPLPKQQARYFIEEWNKLYEAANEEEKVGLAVFAYRLDIHRYAAGMLIDRKSDIRLSGIKILGYMRDESAWPLLEGLLKHPQPEVTLEALKAMLQINIRRALDELLEEIAGRDDWSLPNLFYIFQEVKDEHVCKKLKQYTHRNDAPGQERIQQIYTQLGCGS